MDKFTDVKNLFMIKLLQTDKRWANMKLGNSELTVGRWGCTTTSLSMLSDYFHTFKYPSSLCRELSYTKDGLLLWKSTENAVGLHCERFYGYNTDLINKALLDPRKAVMLEVELGRGSHWVVATRKVGNFYIIADPLSVLPLRSTLNYRNKIIGGSIITKI